MHGHRDAVRVARPRGPSRASETGWLVVAVVAGVAVAAGWIARETWIVRRRRRR
jgi:hypothetical protein